MEILWAISEWRTPVLDAIFSVLTKLGEETVAIVVLCFIYWCLNKRMAYCIGTSYFLANMCTNGLKITFRIDRPWILDPNFQPVGGALKHATSYSFPSGHTTSATALFGTLGLTVRQLWLRILCFAAIPVVAFSRMYLGVHTLADVGVAMVSTLLVAVIIFAAMGKREITGGVCAAVSGVILAVGAALVAYSLILNANGTIDIDYASDCCKVAGAAIGFGVGMWIETALIKFDPKNAKIWQHAIKYVVGLGVMLALKSGLKPIIGESLVADAVRYFTFILWAIAIWPAIFNKIFSKTEKPEVVAETTEA